MSFYHFKMNKFLVVYNKNKLQLIEDAAMLSKMMVINKLKDESCILPRRLQGIIFSSVFTNSKVSIFSTELTFDQVIDLYEISYSEFDQLATPGLLTSHD